MSSEAVREGVLYLLYYFSTSNLDTEIPIVPSGCPCARARIRKRVPFSEAQRST